MKDKIDDFSKGKFQYRLPEVLISPEHLIFTVVEGEQCTLDVCIRNSAGEWMEAYFLCDEPEIELSCKHFEGTEQKISCCFHAEYLSAGRTGKGTVLVVSSFGEIRIPYEVTVIEAEFECSTGLVSNLLQFSDLAHTNWEEARKVFLSDRFSRALVRKRKTEWMLYKGLAKSSFADQAMEEFLRAVRGKAAVWLQLQEKEEEYHLANKPMRDSFRLRKEGWGLIEAKLESDSSFLVLEKERLGQEDFTGDVCEIPFILEPDKLKNGYGVAKVLITTDSQKLTASFQVYGIGGRRIPAVGNLKKREYVIRLVQSLLKWLSGSLTEEQYRTDGRAVFYGLQALGDKISSELVGIYLNLVSGRKQDACTQLECLQEKTLQDWEKAVYCYLCMQAGKLERNEALLQMQQMAQDCEIASLLHLRLKWESPVEPEEVLEEARDIYKKGCKSPFLYLLVWQVWKEKPELLTCLDRLELQVMNWSIKQGLKEEEVTNHFLYVAGSRSCDGQLVLRCLVGLYRLELRQDALMAICIRLLRGGEMAEKQARFWYQLGLEKGLKLTGLYEAYMATFDWESGKEPDSRVYTYFWKDNGLADSKKEHLYAHIICQKEKRPSVYEDYLEQMKGFALRHLAAGKINERLALIYGELLKDEAFIEEVVTYLPNVMFRCLITCDSPEVCGVVVLQKEEKEGVFVPFEPGGTAYVDIYTENVQIILEDRGGRRYVVSRPYEWKRLLQPSDYLEICYEAGCRDKRLLLAMVSWRIHYQKQKEVGQELQKNLLDVPGLNPYYRNEILGELIPYYYDQMEGGLLEVCLAKYDLEYATRQEWIRILDMMLIRDLFSLVGKAIRKYGYMGISLRGLTRLCNKMIAEVEGKDDFLVQLSWYLFRNNHADFVVLDYLTRYYEGSAENLYRIWKSAMEQRMQVAGLEGRLLSQMLFSEQILTGAVDVYESYVRTISMDSGEGTARKKLVRAFLSYLAYRYLVSDQMIPKTLLADMQTEVFYGDAQLCKMAVLKFYSQKPSLTEQEREFSELQMERMVKRGCNLPFYQKFVGKCRMPGRIKNQSYVVYVANQGEEVYIHYRFLEENQNSVWKVERMPDVFYGIYTKELLLFYGETVQYYISIRREDRCDITENMVLKLPYKEDGRVASEQEAEAYQMLNRMLLMQKNEEEKKLIELMEQYVRQDYRKEQLFGLI